MALNADTLLDRLYLKSQINKWRILAIVFGIVAFIAVVERNNKAHSPIEKSYIARLTFDGVVMDNQKIYDLIDEVAENPKAKAVVVWLDTPGGSAVAGEEIYARLRKLSSKKPVVAVMRSVSASAGYMLALGTDYIIAREGTITGSIGVLLESAEVTELAEKLGIKPVVVKSSPLKGTPSMLEKPTPESLKAVQDMINDFYVRFVDIVAERRNIPREKVLTIADGRIYGGKRALELKLIDALGGEEEAYQWLVKVRQVEDGLQIRDIAIEEKKPLLERLTQSIAGNFFPNSSVGLDGLAAIWHPQLY